MLKRRASKRFVLVESGEDNANGSGSASGSGSGSGVGTAVISQFVAVDCGQNESNNNHVGEMSASISNHNSSNNQSSPSLLSVPVVGTLK